MGLYGAKEEAAALVAWLCSAECLSAPADVQYDLLISHETDEDCSMNESSQMPLGFQRLKVAALSVVDLDRANDFYGHILGLLPAFEGSEQVGYLLGQTILMLKPNWYAPPTQQPNPRLTIAVDDARQTEGALKARGVAISDPVQLFDEFWVGSFLDSEGNKLWFCSPEA